MDKEKLTNLFYENSKKLIICKDKEINKVYVPLLAIHETGFFIFFDACEEWNKNEILDKAYQLQLFFNTSRLNFYIYIIDENWAYFIDPFTDDIRILLKDKITTKEFDQSLLLPMKNDELDEYREMYNQTLLEQIKEYERDITGLSYIYSMEEHILDILKSGSFSVDDNKFYYYKEKISLLVSKEETVKSDDEGNIYIRKGNKWFLASDEDPDEMFNFILFGGLFGLHKFKQGNTKAGLGYLLTAGMFCIGWLFDMLSMLLGVYKNPEGLYYQPVSNKKNKAIAFMCCLPLSFLALNIYMSLVNIVTSGLSQIIVSFIN